MGCSLKVNIAIKLVSKLARGAGSKPFRPAMKGIWEPLNEKQ
jgi:hypothetical protein